MGVAITDIRDMVSPVRLIVDIFIQGNYVVVVLDNNMKIKIKNHGDSR